jgi:hypothetical protein
MEHRRRWWLCVEALALLSGLTAAARRSIACVGDPITLGQFGTDAVANTYPSRLAALLGGDDHSRGRTAQYL